MKSRRCLLDNTTVVLITIIYLIIASRYVTERITTLISTAYRILFSLQLVSLLSAFQAVRIILEHGTSTLNSFNIHWTSVCVFRVDFQETGLKYMFPATRFRYSHTSVSACRCIVDAFDFTRILAVYLKRRTRSRVSNREVWGFPRFRTVRKFNKITQ